MTDWRSPPYIPLNRPPKGETNWKENYEIISEAYVSARNSFFSSERRDKRLIEFLLMLREGAKRDKDFVLSDKIRNILSRCNITIKDQQNGKTFYHIQCTFISGEV